MIPRLRPRLVAAVCVTILTLHPQHLFAQEAPAAATKDPPAANVAEPIGAGCWLPVTIATDEILMLRHATPDGTLVMDFHSSEPIDVGPAGPDGTFPEHVFLRAPAGWLVPRDDAFVATMSNGDFRLAKGGRQRLVPVAGTEIAIGAGKQADSGGKLVVDGATVEYKASRSKPLEAQLKEAAALAPYVAAFEVGGEGVRDFVDANPVPSVTPADTLKVRVSRGDIDFVTAFGTDRLRACVRSGKTIEPAPIMAARKLATDETELTLWLSPALRSAAWSREATVALLLPDGSFLGRDTFRITAPWVGMAVALFATFIGHVFIRKFLLTPRVRGKRWQSWLEWFAGPGGKASVSLFQIYIWTWVVFAGLAYVFTLTGQFFSITWEVLTLLGIAGTGSVAARMVALSQGRPPPPADELKFSDLFRSDGVLDLFKLQMFLFTVATAAYVLLRVVLDQAFPVLDTNLLLLLGISNGIYVGSKVAGGESPFQLAERHDLELKLLEEARDNAKGELAALATSIGTVNTEIDSVKTSLTTAVSPQKETLEAQLKSRSADLDLLNARQKTVEAKVADLEKQIEAASKAREEAIGKLAAA